MTRIFKSIVGCSNSIDKNKEESNEPKIANSSFTGTIKEINGNSTIVSAKIFENNPVGYDGIIKESYPAQINTLSVELTV